MYCTENEDDVEKKRAFRGQKRKKNAKGNDKNRTILDQRVRRPRETLCERNGIAKSFETRVFVLSEGRCVLTSRVN